MSRRILVISTSLRRNSNSEALANAFARGAQEAGAEVEQVTLREKQIGFCRGCLACQRTGSCVQKDDAQEIVAKMNYADTIVFATPIYYYELSGQMKTLLDRANPLYGSDYHFREVFLLTAAAEDAPGVDRRAIGGLQGWIDCFDQVRLAGSLFAGGVNAPGEIDGHDALRQAYELGLSQR